MQFIHCTAMQAGWGGCNDAMMQRSHQVHEADAPKEAVRIGGLATPLLDAQRISGGFVD
jgi:hypothetical protein